MIVLQNQEIAALHRNPRNKILNQKIEIQSQNQKIEVPHQQQRRQSRCAAVNQQIQDHFQEDVFKLHVLGEINHVVDQAHLVDHVLQVQHVDHLVPVVILIVRIR